MVSNDLQIMTPVEVRRGGTHLFHEVSVRQFVNGSAGGPAQWDQVSTRGPANRAGGYDPLRVGNGA